MVTRDWFKEMRVQDFLWILARLQLVTYLTSIEAQNKVYVGNGGFITNWNPVNN